VVTLGIQPEDAHVLVQVSPALRTEMFFETFFGLAKDGKTNAKVCPTRSTWR
jgi:hypothetical protein